MVDGLDLEHAECGEQGRGAIVLAVPAAPDRIAPDIEGVLKSNPPPFNHRLSLVHQLPKNDQDAGRNFSKPLYFPANEFTTPHHLHCEVFRCAPTEGTS